MYKQIFRPLLFSMDPERVHGLALTAGRAARFGGIAGAIDALCAPEDPRLAVQAFGLSFRNPIGLAAGFDKDAVAIEFFSALGFGCLEAGTVTPQPQPGNPKPRIFRLPPDAALINRMGFPSEGAEAVGERLRRIARKSLPLRVGVNIGKAKVTPIEQAHEDYARCVETLGDCGDFFVINVSSPNTPDLRTLQQRDRLSALLRAVQQHNSRRKPLLVKVAPDLSWQELDEVLEACEAAGVSGIVATNTTISRDGLMTTSGETGGLSGAPLRRKSMEFLAYIVQRTQGRLPVVSVGGIATADDVIERLRHGAALVQVYTGFVYEGPLFVKRLCSGISAFLEREGLASVAQIRHGRVR